MVELRGRKKELLQICLNLAAMNEEAMATVEQLRDGKPIDRCMVASSVESFVNHVNRQIEKLRTLGKL